MHYKRAREGCSYTDLCGLQKVNGEIALIMTVYNLKGVINILGIETLLKKLKTWKPKYPRLLFFVKNSLIKWLYTLDIFSSQKLAA